MADYAHTETDKAIEKLEKRLQAEYRQAYRETKGKLEKYLSDFARKDEAKRKLLDEGKISADDYKKWRTNQMLTGKRWQAMVDTLTKDMNNTNQIAADIISGKLKGTFALNANYAAYGIENGFHTDYGFTLYNEDTVNRLIAENPDLLPAPRVDVPEDIRWNKQKITSNITQAVLQGKSIPEIAKTMQTVVGMNKASATRNARTAMTGAQNAGRQETYNRAKAMGIKAKKEWIATLDGRTRHSHGMADGQQVELDGKFTVGGSKMRYPGDPQGRPEEVYNCRCTMATVEPAEILRGEEPRMTYQEWYKGKENAANGLKSGGNGGIINTQNFQDNLYDYKFITQNSIDNVAKIDIKGFSQQQCLKLQEAHKSLLTLAQKHPLGTEVSATYSMDMNKLGDTIIGKKGKVKIQSWSVDYIGIHNHPSGETLSYTDVQKYLLNANMKIVSAVGNGGEIYILQKFDDSDVVGYNNFLDKILFNADFDGFSLNELVSPDFDMSKIDKNKCAQILLNCMDEFFKGAEKYGFKYYRGR